MNKKLLLLQLSFVLFSFNCFAQNSNGSFTAKLLVEAGVEYGGDEILQVFFTNGGDQSMKAGQGGYISIGGEFQSEKIKHILLRTSIGIKYNTTAADNANIRFTRIPINLIAYWKVTDDVRLGVGATSHQNVKLKGDGFVSDIDFTSSVGPRFELGYKWFALTYTAINYMDVAEKVVSGNSIGLSVSFAPGM